MKSKVISLRVNSQLYAGCYNAVKGVIGEQEAKKLSTSGAINAVLKSVINQLKKDGVIPSLSDEEADQLMTELDSKVYFTVKGKLEIDPADLIEHTPVQHSYTPLSAPVTSDRIYGMSDIERAKVVHEKFSQAAERIAQLHEDDLRNVAVTTEQIERSSPAESIKEPDSPPWERSNMIPDNVEALKSDPIWQAIPEDDYILKMAVRTVYFNLTFGRWGTPEAASHIEAVAKIYRDWDKKHRNG